MGIFTPKINSNSATKISDYDVYEMVSDLIQELEILLKDDDIFIVKNDPSNRKISISMVKFARNTIRNINTSDI